MKIKITLLLTVLFSVGAVINVNGQTGNTFTGENSGVNNTGNYNTGYGVNTLMNNTSQSNNAFGVGTLTNSSGGFNCAFGNEALSLNGIGRLNCSLGTRTLYYNDSGSANIAIGHRTLESNVDGNNNTAVGYASLLTNKGSSNTVIGSYSPRSLLTGDFNIFVGAETAINLLNGSYNVFLGNRITFPRFPSTPILAGNDTSRSIIIADGIGNQRIFINRNGNMGIGLGNNVIPVNKLDIKGGVAIGRNFTPNGVTPGIVAPANGLLVEGNVGIGTDSPGNKVEITHGATGNSGLRFTNLTSSFNPAANQTANKFLSVDQEGDVVLKNVANAVETNVLQSNANLMTSNVNNITDSATIINSISNAVNNSNQLITTVNGVASVPVNLPTFTDTDAQSLSLSGNTLSISNGNSVTLPTYVDVPQTISQSENTITLSNGGGSFNLPIFIDMPQTLSQSGNTVTLSNGGGTFTLPTFTDTDTDAQALSLTGNTLSISNGNSVTLPTYVDTPQTISQSGNTVTLSNGGGTFTLPTFTDTDTDAQALSLTGNTLSISNGNSVTLPTYVDTPQTISQSGNTVTLSNGGGTFTIPTFTDTDAQALSLTGNTLSISNGNSVTLPTYVDTPQTISQSGNTVTLSNGGGSFSLPTTTVTAGTNVTVTGTGSVATPYVVSAADTSLYANNGTINSATTTSGNRIVSMNDNNIWFKSEPTDTNGKIYIGTNAVYPTTTGKYKLFVEGGILTEKVKVALRSTANWADYVFEKNYKLMPLKNVEEFIATNKHLPGIDSAAELSKNGLDLAEMQAKHMAKIEEMMLYIIEQNKTIEKNIKDIEELKKQVKVLTANED
ncbi:hypothetical protein QWY90_04820 [Flavobacterium paronense]|uniref:Beta strand repeat-containing protein n=1 Tax=Flavobacterium paronense TaxID=1392775 RepID=A0ABV5GFW7_9FLAO|nr:hypothetical protein [Flavobacterium paronense]MDN3676630.1 hypothetical protein [Flavobacterium paronense]